LVVPDGCNRSGDPPLVDRLHESPPTLARIGNVVRVKVVFRDCGPAPARVAGRFVALYRADIPTRLAQLSDVPGEPVTTSVQPEVTVRDALALQQ